MQQPEGLFFTKEHEWLRLDGTEAVVGITDFAQEALGDVVFVELPTVGTEVVAGKPFGVVESNKSVSDLFAPVSGRIAAVNEALADAPEAVNREPYGAGWMIRIAMASADDAKGLLDAKQYEALVENERAR
jgi:glycine cleavage system H protein